jgi:dienelactone hydrolase
MTTRFLLALSLTVVVGCSDRSFGASGASGSGGAVRPGIPPAKGFCNESTAFVYDPASRRLDAFPDDFFTMDDPSSLTGQRVHMVVGENLDESDAHPAYRGLFQDLSTLDGFGTSASITLTFSSWLSETTLPTSAKPPRRGDSVLLVNLDSPEPELVAFDWELVPGANESGRVSLVLTPRAPLEPKTRYGVAVTRGARDLNGACVSPSPALRDILRGKAEDPALARLTGRYAELTKRLSELGALSALGTFDVSAALVFTTQHTVEDSTVIASKIRDKEVVYTPRGPCTDPDPEASTYVICEGSFPADDFRVDGRAIDEGQLAPQASYTLKVTTYLPKEGTRPFPTILYGHGLGGHRHDAEEVAALASARGYATIAIDAVKHGGHPDAPGAGGALESFFAVAGDDPGVFDGLALRDHLRQSTYDKLQLIEMLRAGVDIDGDSAPDVGADRLAYLGESLGGTMSAELMAFAPRVGAFVAAVPGARMADVLGHSVKLADFMAPLEQSTSPEELARFWSMLQTVVDRGDPAAYLKHVWRARLPGFASARPQVLMQMVVEDRWFPTSTNIAFAQGLGVPVIGKELVAMRNVGHVASTAVDGNLNPTHTGGIFQLDLVYQGGGPATKPATHGNMPRSTVAMTQTLHFLDGFVANGISEIVDPYQELGIPR